MTGISRLNRGRGSAERARKGWSVLVLTSVLSVVGAAALAQAPVDNNRVTIAIAPTGWISPAGEVVLQATVTIVDPSARLRGPAGFLLTQGPSVQALRTTGWIPSAPYQLRFTAELAPGLGGFLPGTAEVRVTAFYTAPVDGNPDFLLRSVATAEVTLVLDATPPTVTISADPADLWPPNGGMVAVTVSGTVTDDGSGVDPATCFFSVADDYGMIQPAAGITLDDQGHYSFTLMLEARRSGQDLGDRHYAITVGASDRVGNQGSATTVVMVPHDQM